MLGFNAVHGGTIAPNVSLVVGFWTDDLDSLWRAAVRAAIDRTRGVVSLHQRPSAEACGRHANVLARAICSSISKGR